MNVPNIIVVVVGTSFVVAVTILADAAALRGLDLQTFNQLRESDPRYFRNMVRTLRINGVLVLLMCVGGLIIAPSVIFNPEGGPLLALFGILFSVNWLWLAWRWLRWAWQVRL